MGPFGLGLTPHDSESGSSTPATCVIRVELSEVEMGAVETGYQIEPSAAAAMVRTMLKPQINSLQAGRALAAVSVVIHHAALAAVSFAGPFPGSAILEAGYLGVDFFFVLSGFIIHHSTHGKDLATYAVSRVRRVYLPYIPIGIGIALLYTWAPQLSAADRAWSWLPTLTLLPVNGGTALSVAWTLKHEIFFYALFAALYFSGRLAIGLAVWSVSILVANVAGYSIIPLALINLEFVFGILIAVAARRGMGSRWWYLAAILALAAWVAVGGHREYSPLVGLAFAFAILPTVRFEREEHFSVPPWLLLLGAASYAIYLTHGVAISVIARLTPMVPLIIAGGITASLAVGLGYYWLIETPLLRLFAKHTRSISLSPPTPNVADS
jgi:peptidoglycan/LPS O-acetylase OafA/YrhL